MKVERGEADIALEEQQEHLQNLESIVIEVEDERMLDANVKVEIVGAEEGAEDQGAVGGVVNDQQDQGDQGEGREGRGAKPKKEKKKKVRGEEGAREDDVDPFEVKKNRVGKMRGF